MIVLVVFLAAVLASPTLAQSDLLSTLDPKPIAIGFVEPTSITHAGDGSGRLFITERAGRIWILDRDFERAPEPFLDIRGRVGDVGGEQGLLSMAFHPDYASNGRFFVNYTDDKQVTIIGQFVTLADDADKADAESEEIYFSVEQPYDNHNGGQIHFGPDGMLYVGLGDGGSGGDPEERAQSLQTVLGSMLRLDVDQGAPAVAPRDNPFFEAPDALSATWAIGLRNPWRFSFDRATGDLWIGDVGENDWEEVNFVPAGEGAGINFGWRFMEGGHCFIPGEGCNDGSLTLPAIEYAHEGGACSVTGGYRYRGARYPELDGVYFFADFCSWMLHGLVGTGPGEFEPLTPLNIGGSISTFGEDEAGELYFANYYDGRIFRIDAGPQRPRISSEGIVDGATFASGPVAPGSIVSVFGAALAENVAEAAQTPLPTELDGARFDLGGLAAPVFFVSPGQVNLQLPWELAGSGSTTLTAFVGNLQSTSAAFDLVELNPGVFTLDLSGTGQAAALISGTGLLAAPSGSFPNARPVRRGEFLEIFGNGFGPVSNTPASGAASPADPLAETRTQVRVRIGDRAPVPVSFAGLAPGLVGAYQINVEVTEGLPSGPAVPLTFLVGEAESNTVTVAID